MRLVTWNVWFSEWCRELRQQALWAELTARDPDVICLQEVLPDHLAGPEVRALRRRPYFLSDARFTDYDVLIASRRPVRAFERVPLPSQMGRELLVARLATRPALTVATVHLESTDRMTALRCRQLAEITAHLAHEEDVLLVGDMNFPASDRPEAAYLAGWRDVWPQLHPGDPGFTVDTTVNRMRSARKPGEKRARIDRVFHRGDRWRIDAISLLGTTPIPDPDPDLFISDHFGLQVDLSPA